MKSRLKIGIYLFALFVFFGRAPQAGAFFLNDWFNSLTGRASLQPLKDFSLDSNVSLAPNGDINKNNTVDGGDIVRFSYTIDNPQNKEISFATLKTNIPRNHLNFIHNISGTPSLSDKGNTITIPNLRINPGQKVIISFDARVNYFTDSDKIISTEPELIASDKKSLVKSDKKEVKVKLWKGKLPSNIFKKEVSKP